MGDIAAMKEWQPGKYISQLEADNEILNLAISGDIILSASPATTGSSAAAVTTAIASAASKYTRTVKLKLATAAGTIHAWYSGSLAIAVAEVTAGNGVCAIAASATTAKFTDGEATVVLEYTGTWAASDTQTLTVTGSTVAGVTVANKTSVDTLIA